MSIPEAFSHEGQRIISARDHDGPTGPGAALLDEHVRLTVAGDWYAFRALQTVLSPFVRDSAACLYGHNGIGRHHRRGVQRCVEAGPQVPTRP